MKYLVVACLFVATMPLQAAVPVEQAIELCRAEQNALRRLTCYDAIENKSENMTKQSVSASQEKPEIHTQTTTTDDFGLEHRKVEAQSTDRVYVNVKNVGYNERKERVFEFDNGQIWRQTDSGYYAINPGETHFIKRGMLNSFFLGNDNNNRTVRVRREK